MWLDPPNDILAKGLKVRRGCAVLLSTFKTASPQVQCCELLVLAYARPYLLTLSVSACSFVMCFCVSVVLLSSLLRRSATTGTRKWLNQFLAR